MSDRVEPFSQRRPFVIVAIVGLFAACTAVAAPVITDLFGNRPAAQQISAFEFDAKPSQPSRDAQVGLLGLQERGGDGIQAGELYLDRAQQLFTPEDGAPFELVIVPSSSGDLCFATVIDRAVVTDCEAQFSYERPGATLAMASDDSALFYGVVADGVVRVRVAGRDAELHQNVYWVSALFSDLSGDSASVEFELADGTTSTLHVPVPR